jgi:mono/diheme cytochrome c family protein
VLGRLGRGGDAVRAAEPIALAVAVVGVALSGLTGLLVWGQAQTQLRGPDFLIGQLHFWIGIAIAVLVAVPALLRVVQWTRGRPAGRVLGATLGASVLATGLVAAQGYLGGRETYEHGVGIQAGGQFEQTAVAAARLDASLARGTAPAVAGKAAFADEGLGCASCHGDRAQGERGPDLAGGRDLTDFRRVHGTGLFPRPVVSDRDFQAVNAYLNTLSGSDRADASAR